MTQEAEAWESTPCYVGEPALPCKGECRRRIHVCRRSKVRIGRSASGSGAHIWFCLRTTFERILRDEVTTAAQVSSAEDSRARTVKCLRSAAPSRRGESNRRGRLIRDCVTGSPGSPGTVALTPPCLPKSYPPVPVHSPVVPLSSSPDHALIPSIPEPPTHSSARMPALLHPRSHPVQAVVGPPRSTHPHPRCATTCEIAKPSFHCLSR